MDNKITSYENFNILSALWDKFIYDPFFLNSLTPKDLLSLFGLSRYPSYIMCISLDGCSYLTLDTRSYTLYLTFYKILENLLEDQEFNLIFAHQNCFYINGHLPSSLINKGGSYKEELKKVAERIKKELEVRKGNFKFSSITIGVDFNRNISPKKWREMAQHAIVVHRRKLFEGRGRIFWWDEYKLKQESITSNIMKFSEIHDKLIESILVRDFKNIDHDLISILQDVFSNNLGRLLYLRIQLTEGISSVAHAAIAVGVSDIEVTRIVIDFVEKVNQIYDPIDLFTITYYAFENLISLIKDTPTVMDPVISLILTKIMRSEDLSTISLKQISQDIPINYFWLSRLFKRKVGISFTEYLNKEKCKRAQKLLLYSNKNITDIAFDCGFNSVQHFERVFKKMFGITPNKFRIAGGKINGANFPE